MLSLVNKFWGGYGDVEPQNNTAWKAGGVPHAYPQNTEVLHINQYRKYESVFCVLNMLRAG